MKFWRFLFGFLIFVLVFGMGGWFLLIREIPQPHIADPAELFNHGSIGNETAQGIPYWLWRVLPEVFPEHLPQGTEDTKASWEAIGISWPEGEGLPVGFSQKTLGVIPRVAPNCAFCHQGTYRLEAEGKSQIVTAGAGTQIDVQSFIRFLIAVGQDDRFNASEIMPAIEKHYDMPLWERLIYRYLLVPGTKLALKGQAKQFAWTMDNPDWGIGRIDPFNPVKYTILELENDGTIGNSDMMPLWNLQEAKPTKQQRYSVHWDGLLADVHETVIAGAIGDGMTYKSFHGTKANLDVMENFINIVEPPKSPFNSTRDPNDPFYVDAQHVLEGQQVFASHCASCHQPGGERFRQPIPISEVGTDRHRLDMWTQEARDRYAAYQNSYDWGFEHFHKTDGYVAVGLTGLWLRGPYLHNGSVPNLRTLLTPPDERPKSFYRGSDLVDPDNGGFISDAAQDPHSRHWSVETSVPGNSNRGHIWGTELPQNEKDALLAYLKTR